VFRGESRAPICFLEAPPCQPSHARRPLTARAPCCPHAAVALDVGGVLHRALRAGEGHPRDPTLVTRPCASSLQSWQRLVVPQHRPWSRPGQRPPHESRRRRARFAPQITPWRPTARRLNSLPQVSSPRTFAQSARLMKLPRPCIQPSRRTWLGCASVTAGAPYSSSAHLGPRNALAAHQLTLCAYLRRRSNRPSAPPAIAGGRVVRAT
jgi:hypothetical protein